ncbi:SDR family oxidoreductase [Subtercola vilae]|uniref:SDR family oxidoreductase n=1 Tax=Subtercola vilae TaxID=2056433 RepID=A0A4T2CAS1_9MICO|nr:SDR family oxidoreductase [Subtercola vilae]TIH40949.1 SDR family oxidoreductase [Subtercola vilae]
MSLVVTGATGHLGRLAIDHLIARGTPPADIVAAGRDAGRLDALKSLGVRTAVIDFTDPATLAAAFEGAEGVLLVSGSEVGSRVQQHINAIDAAKAAGVTQIVYTSAPKADNTTLVLAPEHTATEEYLRASGVDFTIVRNNWYNENYTQTLGQVQQTGVYLASTGTGRVASASRSDYAEAAAVVLSTPGHTNATYELSGDVAWNGDDFAATLSDVLNRDVVFESVSSEAHTEVLRSAGLDEGTIGFITALDANIAAGELDKITDDLSTLIGHPTTPVADTLRTVLS